jgi:hypothetical protein
MVTWRTHLVAASIIALACGYFLFHSPNVTLRSSDGRWADSEIQSKGRSFDELVWNFEGYKLSCSALDAKLVRATPEFWYDVFAWPNYLTDRKWHVPYSNTHPEIGDYYPQTTMQNCATAPKSPALMKQADAETARYLAMLK